jgi:hypothetical protein
LQSINSSKHNQAQDPLRCVHKFQIKNHTADTVEQFKRTMDELEAQPSKKIVANWQRFNNPDRTEGCREAIRESYSCWWFFSFAVPEQRMG